MADVSAGAVLLGNGLGSLSGMLMTGVIVGSEGAAGGSEGAEGGIKGTAGRGDVAGIEAFVGTNTGDGDEAAGKFPALLGVEQLEGCETSTVTVIVVV